MWNPSEGDPGGVPRTELPSGSNQELSDLKDQNEQQSVLIAQLKEILRKSEQSNVTHEKVDEYMNTLSKHSAKVKKQKNVSGNSQKKTTDIPASQKINLLRQQVEENKARLAERGKSQKGIEEMVTQLKAQLDDSQLLIQQQTPLNITLQEDKIEYTEHSSSEELYTILVTKDKRITDLISKVHKLESNVLDLQENVKEKDSVIDARTKAITLMTENLTKKSKGTLDALDETKEQMRKMQNDFIELEADMKARQMKLLEDLRLKNYEIAELQETNSKLESELGNLNKKLELPEKNESIKTQLELLKLENDSLKNEINTLKKKESAIMSDDGELGKLRKQLDESNKNMIKVKAQHKSKVKDLTKKIENFKKISDVNAELVRLEGENGKLNQKIAELEEEKGAMQLKMVESDPGRPDSTELADKIAQQEQMLSEKEKIISLLEAEIVASKSTLSEKVTSEMATIQFEEQFEHLEKEIARLTEQNEAITREKQELVDNSETLKKEKVDLQAKLDHYIQENIDLVDKLEKLSVEKVSSAESIEIVEGLTQQELEAYQTNLEMVAGNLKTSEEHLPAADLNETVNELNEETSELLQKIELFTVERREVMEKMETLRQENGELCLKIKEVENNRDVLAETYEQLQTEKEALDAKVDSLEGEINTLKDIKSDCKDEFSEEIGRYKQELEEAEKHLRNLQLQLEERDRYNTELNNRVVDLNKVVTELENRNYDLQTKVDQLNETVEKQGDELEKLANRQWEDQRLIESKENDLQKLMKEQENTESVIEDLHKIIEEKDEKFQKLTSELKDKYLHLQQQMNANSDSFADIRKPLEEKIEELTAKNKEQLDKMKKIAANLKKKTQSHQELEEKYKDIQQKWENEVREKDGKVQNLLQEMQVLEDEVKTLREAVQEKSHQLQLQTDELETIQSRNAELQGVIADLRSKSESVNLQQELLQTHESLGPVVENTENVLQSKIQELEMIIEIQEADLQKFRDRVGKLEEGLAFVEARRASTERKATELGAQLEEKSVTCEEMTASEDVLEQRLTDLIFQDEDTKKKLQEITAENQELNQKNSKLSEKVDKLKVKLQHTINKIKELESKSHNSEELEVENDGLKKTVANLELHLTNLQSEHERVLIEIKNDLERVNSEWQTQFDQIFKEKTELLIRCEKFEEELREITEKEFAFNNELLLDYKGKLERSENEIKQYEVEIQRLSSLDLELQDLKRSIQEKDALIEDLKNNQRQSVQPEEPTRSLASFFDSPSDSVSHPVQIAEPVKPPTSSDFSFFDSPKEDNTEILQKLRTLENEKETLEKKLSAVEEQLEISQQELESALKHASARADQFLRSPSTDHSELTQKLEEAEAEKELATRELNVVSLQLEQANELIAQLRLKLELKPIAEETVDSVIKEAESRLSEESIQEKIAESFAWPEQGTSEVDFTVPPASSNTQEELLNKIKTLEFMLFDVEKAKDEALLQCHHLSNELARLVYERGHGNHQTLESQIVSVEEIVDAERTKRELEQLEFTETKSPTATSAQPVCEEIIQPKTAYLCYDTEDQIDSNEAAAFTEQTRREMQALEFEPSHSVRPQSDVPIVEQEMEREHAYQCFDPAEPNTFGENDDGWGWGPEEAKLEEEHVQKMDNKTLEHRVQELEHERESHIEEIKQLHLKTAKLIKKLKEFKQRNEELSSAKKNEGDFFNLDDAIQEELKLQVEQIEKKFKETSAELEKERLEKSAIAKRIEVLTAANERMVDMKEKQDIEMLGWKRNCQELTAKLEQVEWGADDGFAEKTSETSAVDKDYGKLEEMQKHIEALNETVKDLSADNEELQALLEEQRTLRLNAEKCKPVEISSEDYQTILTERDRLSEELQHSIDQRQVLQDQVNELINKNTGFLEKFDELEKGREELAAFVATKDSMIQQLNETVHAIQIEKNKLHDEISSAENEKLEYVRSVKLQESNMVTELVKEKEIVFNELLEKNAQIEHLKDTLEKQAQELRDELDCQIQNAQSLLDENQLLRTNIQSLQETLFEKELTQGQLTQTIEQLTQEIERLTQREAEYQSQNSELLEKLSREKENPDQSQSTELLEQLNQENAGLKESLASKETEYQTKHAELLAAMDHLSQEWQMRVDQRGTDVGESWKLHLETRESEFAQLEHKLRKEINELEEKCNGLVNENNELRRNVDTEIRNEVDRLAALENQIAERQQLINELNSTLQEKQNEIESLQTELNQLREQAQINENLLTSISEELARVNVPFDKENVLNSLHQLKEDKDVAVNTIRQELITLQEELTEIMNDSKLQIEMLNRSLEDRDITITNMTEQLNEIRSLKDYEHENSRNLQHTASEHQQTIAGLTIRLEEANNRQAELREQLQEKDAEIDTLKRYLEDREAKLTENHQLMRTIEVLKNEAKENSDKLRLVVDQKEELVMDCSAEVNLLRQQLELAQKHNEELLIDRNAESETSQALKTERDRLTQELSARVEECIQLQGKIDEQTALMDEENKQLEELRSIIETQVLKIEELKKELFEKSNDYDSLIAEMDISRNSSQVNAVKEIAQSSAKKYVDDDLSEPVNRAELDLALYMLHQRDVRCEELTVELTQLLEERDTLQLKLSNAIREKEELNRKQTAGEASGSQPVVDQPSDSLVDKLSELKTVGYKRDKTIVDEQELRQMQQLSIMQQHREDAAKLPPEAAARLVDANYTLSRDVQSPSKVLLNWLWGKSTPRVNDV